MNLVLDQPQAVKAKGIASDAFSTSVDNDAWLDEVLAEPPHRSPFHDHADHVASRLRTIAFETVVAAVERARPCLSPQAEIRLYQSWIAANADSSPLTFAAWFNSGVALSRAGDRVNAAVAYRNALVLKPTFHSAAINLGLALEAMGRAEEALQAWESALQGQDARIALLTQKGRLLERLGRLDEAEAVLRGLLAMDPGLPDVVHHWVHIRQKICSWPAVAPEVPGLPPAELLRQSGPLGVLALTDDVGVQREAARNWIARKTEPAAIRLCPIGGYRHDRIRIGYLSSDFCRHAMSYLITELFERHDRTRFEVFGYCSSNEDGSDLRRRVIGAFDHHRCIRNVSDQDAAALIQKDEIDILVDLNGITDGTRIQILRWRPAPIQATYLGFIGSVPLPELDYLFCDDFVIPADHHAAYEPTPLPIGQIYQANDTKRVIGPTLSRHDVGLPYDKFVFCCFSNHYKITEDLFAAWMSILRRSPDSVLWLSADNSWSQRNLREAAVRAGVEAARIIFAPRTSPELYMSRLCLGDLFLDTFPYNAGTIASDAIRMKLPLLTLSGRSFASRMAGSLLTAIGAQEGVTFAMADYVDKATELAGHAGSYARFRAHFEGDAWARRIGNIALFTAELEQTLEGLVRGPKPALTASPATRAVPPGTWR